MQLKVNKLIPGFLKSFYWQKYLRINISRNNILGRKIAFSKDLVIGEKCKINNEVVFGRNVRLGSNILIGRNAFIENIDIGNNTTFEGNVVCTGLGSGKIKIGHNCYIGIYNVLDWSDDITIGDFVHIAGPSTALWTHSSASMCLNGISLDNKSKKYRPTNPIVIESNVYIGGNCTIYPGVKIGHHSIVAPNSAVTKDIEAYCMVGGVPAKFIKRLDIKLI